MGRMICSLTIACMALSSCMQQQTGQKQTVISQRFIHKYGYDLSPSEWESENYPGQVVTVLKNGITMTATYEEGELHGITTYTHPYSNTIAYQLLYERGQLLKKAAYDVRGIPRQEESYYPDHVEIRHWYTTTGAPRAIEEYYQGKLREGKYFSHQNEIEGTVCNGEGERISRNEQGLLLSKEQYKDGKCVQMTSYYSNGIPHMTISYQNQNLHGERKTFASSGEPLSIEYFCHNLPHGTATYFQNGVKYLEIDFLHGKRHGMERHFVDGETLIKQAKWEHDFQHGPSSVYSDGFVRTEWFFNGKKVTKERFDALTSQERLLVTMTARAHKKH